MTKCVFRESKDPDQQAEIYSLIRNLYIVCYVLQYPLVLQADKEGPDQTAPMRMLIWAFPVCISPKIGLRMAWPIFAFT